MTADAASPALVSRIRDGVHAAADPARAPGQQAYMRSAMPFLGVTVPEARKIARSACGHDETAATLLAAARVLWDGADHREERYAALALLGMPVLRGDPDLLPLIEHMVRTGRWWDFTDELAHRVADLLDADPTRMAAVVRSWAGDENLWMRRLAVIAQLGRRERLDRLLLEDVIDATAEDPDFFVRKAIGWALRDAARTDPDWVRGFVSTRQLSPLSRREATRRL